jgi:hypothetical protein
MRKRSLRWKHLWPHSPSHTGPNVDRWLETALARASGEALYTPDTEELARALKDIVQQQGRPGDALLKDAPDAGCKL